MNAARLYYSRASDKSSLSRHAAISYSRTSSNHPLLGVELNYIQHLPDHWRKIQILPILKLSPLSFFQFFQIIWRKIQILKLSEKIWHSIHILKLRACGMIKQCITFIPLQCIQSCLKFCR